MKKLIFFDFDGTLTDSSSWLLFNTHFGMTPGEDHSLFQRYLQNEIDYKSWNQEIAKIIRNRSLCNEDSLKEFIKTIKPREESFDVIKACKEAGYTVAVVSGGSKQVVEPISQALGADIIATTAEFVFDEAGDFESIIDSGDEREAKLLVFNKICQEYNVNPEETIAVGDGGNDLEIFKRSKKAILLGDYEPLKEYAWKHVENLDEIKQLL